MSLALLKPIKGTIHIGKKEIQTKLWYTHFDTVNDFYSEILDQCKELGVNCRKKIRVISDNRILNGGESCTVFSKSETIDIFI